MEVEECLGRAETERRLGEDPKGTYDQMPDDCFEDIGGEECHTDKVWKCLSVREVWGGGDV